MSGRGRPTDRSRPAARWSWHRLDEPAARRLVDASGVGPGDLVLDLGAGDGALTRHLAATGARVIAFELHPARAAALRAELATTHATPVKVVRADVRDLRLPTRPYRVVANPPFDGVSAVLARLTHPASRLERADLIVPLATAHRWCDRLVRDRSPWRLRIAARLPRSAFRPRPRIDTCHVVVEPAAAVVVARRP